MAEPLLPDDSLRMLSMKLIKASQEWFPEIYNRPTRERVIHATLGISGEAGELANYVKKLNRTDGDLDEHLLGAAVMEAADVLIYALLFFAIVGIDPWEIAAQKHAMNELRFGNRSTNSSGR